MMADDMVIGNYPQQSKVEYITTYKPSLLVSIPRMKQRAALGVTEDALPFRGTDTWNAFEFTWLNHRGKPEVALAQFQVQLNPSILSNQNP